MGNVTKIYNMLELEDFARVFVQKISAPSDFKKATVVGLRGELGAGKTAFTKAVAKIMGVEHNVTSPTFVIFKNYELAPQKTVSPNFSHLIHIDAYRLKNSHELEVLGWKDLLADKNNLIMIEWPEIVADAMPLDTIYLDFKHINETTREIYEK